MVNIRTQFLQIKLRSFYIRFINRATITNVWKYHFSFEPMLCSFCRVEVESRMHLYWECPIVQELWLQVIDFCDNFVSNGVDYSRANCILLGFANPLLNLIMTYCKYYIHICRLFQYCLDFDVFVKRLKRLGNLEFQVYNTFPSFSLFKFYRFWGALARDSTSF